MWTIINEIKGSNLSDRSKIVCVANLMVGQDEKQGNSGFFDPAVEALMKKTGWKTGWAWCCSAVEMIYDLTLPELDEKLEPYFSAGCTKTLEQFRNAGYDVSMVPEPGSIMIMQVDDGWQGHAGIVIHSEGEKIYTVEGNTNPEGGREGYTFARKERIYTDTSGNIDVVGFIKIV